MLKCKEKLKARNMKKSISLIASSLFQINRYTPLGLHHSRSQTPIFHKATLLILSFLDVILVQNTQHNTTQQIKIVFNLNVQETTRYHFQEGKVMKMQDWMGRKEGK